MSLKAAPRRRQRNVESIAPALALLAQGAQAKRAAQLMSVSPATILNWMDWAWKYREKVEPYLLEQYPDLTQQQWDHLWTRIDRRRAKRERRTDFEGLWAKA